MMFHFKAEYKNNTQQAHSLLLHMFTGECFVTCKVMTAKEGDLVKGLEYKDLFLIVISKLAVVLSCLVSWDFFF